MYTAEHLRNHSLCQCVIIIVTEYKRKIIIINLGVYTNEKDTEYTVHIIIL